MELRTKHKDEDRRSSRQMTIAKKIALITDGNFNN